MPNCVANDWNKMGDRDVFGYYINRMQRGLLQVCGMLNTREGMLREGKKIRVYVDK
jgi:hypothetical protein